MRQERVVQIQGQVNLIENAKFPAEYVTKQKSI